MKCIKCLSETRVLETRSSYSELVKKRRCICGECGHKFNTYEVDGTIWNTVRGYMAIHEAAINKKRKLYERNRLIEVQLRAGVKHLAIASEFGLSPNMVSYLAKQMGIPSPRSKKLKK